MVQWGNMAAPVRFELTHSLHCLTDFKSAPLNRLGTAPEYKKATISYKTVAFDPLGRYYPARFKMLFALYECMAKDPADERSDADSIDRKVVKNILRLFHLIEFTIP